MSTRGAHSQQEVPGLRLPEPILVRDLFADDRAALLDLLSGLTGDQWKLPTACEGWSVHDVAVHLLRGDLSKLSRGRDGWDGPPPDPGEDLAVFIGRLNDEWWRAVQRLSPRVLLDLLARAGQEVFAYLAMLDPHAPGAPVSWAGPEPAPVWLDLAREYTERWHHQQHIRDAVGRPGQTERRFLHPVLATFAYALPVALRGTASPAGTVVHLHISGDAGGDWSVAREGNAWRLYMGVPAVPAAGVVLDQTTAWRLFTRGLTPFEAARSATLAGDRGLGEHLLRAVAIIA